MNNIKFQLFDKGLDIKINRDWYSIEEYSGLYGLKNVDKFKDIVVNKKKCQVEYEDCCKEESFFEKKMFINNWLLTD